MLDGILFQLRAEGKEGKLRDFKALDAARNANDREAIDDTDRQMQKRHFPAAENDPKRVGNGMRFKMQGDLFAIGRQGERGDLEALDSERDAHDRQAQKRPDREPCKCKPNAADQNPNDV